MRHSRSGFLAQTGVRYGRETMRRAEIPVLDDVDEQLHSAVRLVSRIARLRKSL